MGAGAPIGNANARGKLWRQALIRALEKRAADNGRHRNDELDALADKLIAACFGDDLGALKELADRLDGKPATVLAGDDDLPPVKVDGFVRLVRPTDPVGE